MTRLSLVMTALLGLGMAARAADSPPPYRVLFAGDSLMKEVGRAARRQVEKTGGQADLESSIGSGLARLDLFDWPAKLREKLAAKPAMAVMLIGANDEQAIDSPAGPVAYGAAGWEEAYAKRVDAMLAAAREAGVPVCWVGLPRMRDAKADAHARLLNRLFQERIAAAGKAGGATYLDIYELYSLNGKYSPFILVPPNNKVLEVREGDGIHFSRSGADHLAAYILGKIR